MTATLLLGGAWVGAGPAGAAITASDRLSAGQVAHGTGAKWSDATGTVASFGVASFNVCVCLTLPQARADVTRLLAIGGLDVIGWQETDVNASVYEDLPGWTTVHDMRTPTKAHDLAVSWRSSEFELVDYAYTAMHDGSLSTAGESTIFPSRWLLTVRLRPLADPSHVLTVFDTHTNQHVERWDDRAPGRPYDNLNADRARIHFRALDRVLAERAGDPDRTRWAVLLGDLNWDYVADQRTLLPGFVESRVGEWAVSNWESMGVAKRPYSHPRSKRRIDYVFVPRDAAEHFRRESVRRGYFSDHRPVVAWIGLD